MTFYKKIQTKEAKGFVDNLIKFLSQISLKFLRNQ